jgi:hypothetical protein
MVVVEGAQDGGGHCFRWLGRINRSEHASAAVEVQEGFGFGVVEAKTALDCGTVGVIGSSGPGAAGDASAGHVVGHVEVDDGVDGRSIDMLGLPESAGEPIDDVPVAADHLERVVEDGQHQIVGCQLAARQPGGYVTPHNAAVDGAIAEELSARLDRNVEVAPEGGGLGALARPGRP